LIKESSSVAKALPRLGTGARAAGVDLQHGRGESARVSQFSRDRRDMSLWVKWLRLRVYRRAGGSDGRGGGLAGWL